MGGYQRPSIYGIIQPIMPRLIDLVGSMFGRLTVVKRSGAVRGRPSWLCVCSCGEIRVVSGSDLRGGDTKSCGCLQIEWARSGKSQTTHGMRYTTEYKIWVGMKQRCLNPNDKAYPDYGGRGITVCPEWINSFEVFLSDMGNRPSKNHSLDRGDNDGPYSPSNCRWSTRGEQGNNQRTNRVLEYDGRKLTMAEWARYFGVNYRTLKWAIGRGETLESIVIRMSL